MSDDFNELFQVVRPLVNEYFELHRRLVRAYDGNTDFRSNELAELAEKIPVYLETQARIFRREADRYRTGRY
ncbi:hypothetical protein [Amycolatopsis sulphurea]|nr:hypothetical protein [Amycolatopsis sulphurea]